MKSSTDWADQRLNYHNRGILSADEITRQLIDEAAYRGIDIATTLASLPEQYKSAIANFFTRFTPEDFLPVSYVGYMTQKEKREYGERLLSTAKAVVTYLENCQS